MHTPTNFYFHFAQTNIHTEIVVFLSFFAARVTFYTNSIACWSLSRKRKRAHCALPTHAAGTLEWKIYYVRKSDKNILSWTMPPPPLPSSACCYFFSTQKCIPKLHTLIFCASALLTEHINAYYSTEIISLRPFLFFVLLTAWKKAYFSSAIWHIDNSTLSHQPFSQSICVNECEKFAATPDTRK